MAAKAAQSQRPSRSFARIARAAWTVSCALSCGLPLHAAEQITLKNGFDLVCDRKDLVNGRMRLYTGGNFVEVNPSDIASVQIVPDAAPAPLKNTDPAATPPAKSQIQPALTAAELHELISRAGAQHNLDVDLLASVVGAESGGNVRAVSRTGAQGLMQLMPGTAAQMGVSDSFKPDQNIQGGTAYLDALLVQYHDNLALALAAYNAGPAAVARYGGVPPYRETRAYVARVILEFNRRKRAEIRQQIAASRQPAPSR